MAGADDGSQREGRGHPAWAVGTNVSLPAARRLGSRQDSGPNQYCGVIPLAGKRRASHSSPSQVGRETMCLEVKVT